MTSFTNHKQESKPQFLCQTEHRSEAIEIKNTMKSSLPPTTLSMDDKKHALTTEGTVHQRKHKNPTIDALVNEADNFFNNNEIHVALAGYKRALALTQETSIEQELLPEALSHANFETSELDREERDCNNESSCEATLVTDTGQDDNVEYNHMIPLILNRIASCQILQDEYPSAVKSCNDAIERCKAMGLEDKHPLVKSTEEALANLDHMVSIIQPAIELNSNGQSFETKGQYDNALKAYFDALRIIKSLGKYHPLIATILNRVGVIYWKTGDYMNALKPLDEALTILDKTLGENHLDNADIYCTLGNVHQSKGDYNHAMNCYQTALTLCKLSLNDDHPEIAKILIRIGMVYDDNGEIIKAMDFFQQGLSIQKKHFEDIHIDIATSLNCVGVIYEKQQEYHKSLAYFEEALQIYSCLCNENNVDKGLTLSNIAGAYRHLGKYEDAMEAYRKALNIMSDTLGRNHRNVAAVLHNIALIHCYKTEYKEALELYKEVYSLQKSLLGQNHPDVALTLFNMGEVYEKRGDEIKDVHEANDRFRKALILYKKALRARRSSFGADHFFIAITLQKIGKFHQEKDCNLSQSLRRYHEALRLYRINSLDESNAYVAETVKSIAFVEQQMALNNDDYLYHNSSGSFSAPGEITPHSKVLTP